MDTPSFLFVNGIKPDRTALRQIRSHAMRGKNAGRVLPPRQARHSRRGPARGLARKEQLPKPASQEGDRCVILEPSRCSLRDVMRTQRTPLELTPAALQVVSKCMFPGQAACHRYSLGLDQKRLINRLWPCHGEAVPTPAGSAARCLPHGVAADSARRRGW